MSFTVKNFDQILDDWIAWVISHSSQITDMTPGSVIRSFCEGGSLAIEELYVAIYLGFNRYLDNIQELVFDFSRKSGTKATVQVVFSRSGTSGTITIPIGTRLKTASGLRFITTATGTIANGNTSSAAVEVEAEKVGTAYNVSDGSVTVIEDTIVGVESVTNALAATGGVDQESKLAYKNRFQAYIEGLAGSNLAGIKYAALSVEGITSVSVIENFPAVAPDYVNVSVYVDDGSVDGVSDAKVEEVQAVIDGDGTEDNPGYRAAGVRVTAIKPTVQSQDITLIITAIAGVDTEQVISDVEDALTRYVNTLGVGNNIVYHELVAAVMNVYGVYDVEFTDPTDDVTVAATQVGRVGTISASVA